MCFVSTDCLLANKGVKSSCRQGGNLRCRLTWVAVVPDTPPSAPLASTPRGKIEIELPRARLLVRGPVDLAVLERVLASLSR